MSPCAPISVLISTYAGVKPEWLRSSLKSIATQSFPPAQVVLVVDGEIAAEQWQVIESMRDGAPEIEWTVLPQSRKGLAAALNHGLTAATQDFIARMDSDDICHQDRFKIQFEKLMADASIDVICSWQDEFEVEGKIQGLKKTRESHNEIARALNYRNVISHPTIILKRKLLEHVGGYSESVGLLEDYDLHLRLLSAGARYYCVQQPLVHVRVSPEQKRRRGGVAYMWGEMRFRTRAALAGKINVPGWTVGVLVYPIFRISPAWLKGFFYTMVRSGR